MGLNIVGGVEDRHRNDQGRKFGDGDQGRQQVDWGHKKGRDWRDRMEDMRWGDHKKGGRRHWGGGHGGDWGVEHLRVDR